MKKLAFAVSVASGAVALFSNHNAEASTQHTVQAGESLWSIAQKYNISVDSIKQSNNLSNNIIFPGQVLTIGGSSSSNSNSSSSSISTSSSVYTVQSGDSLSFIAKKYGISVDALMKANNLSGYLITPNQQLRIPSGNTATSTATPKAATSNSNNGYTSPTYSHQNLYTAGQCTWYVFNRRAQAGLPISTYWSDAKFWAGNAAQDGYLVNHVATVGSIMQTTDGFYGHVAYVERVNADGSILISEMNYLNGPYNTNTRIIPASSVSSYNYIH